MRKKEKEMKGAPLVQFKITCSINFILLQFRIFLAIINLFAFLPIFWKFLDDF